ncbi:hypothetical protein PAXRUDRAFT_28681 [Paxillus rubicundulus Ve08.2h10]|uniref:Uncharacterized protein n=1 Tax=Paxillus rubicundulus Ve08.2h10 TaxID=930991 RepID=A0A0D0DBY4_9AGAM|nr:hypothetical protein PAXRUDRAFT_28681 [Paxillus rubicundulus Ve08.2h10]
MPHSQPRKRPRNISGFHDDLDQHDSESDEEFENTVVVAFDGLKINFEEAYGDNNDSDLSDINEEFEFGILEDEELGKNLWRGSRKKRRRILSGFQTGCKEKGSSMQ